MRAAQHHSAFLIASILCLGLTSCTEKESHEPIVMMAVGLQGLQEYWGKHGRPTNFEPADVMMSSAERYYVFTNAIAVEGKVHRCRFAVRSQLIRTPGIMAITDEGALLWIYDHDGRVIVSPEKNGIERTHLN